MNFSTFESLRHGSFCSIRKNFYYCIKNDVCTVVSRSFVKLFDKIFAYIIICIHKYTVSSSCSPTAEISCCGRTGILFVIHMNTLIFFCIFITDFSR